MNVAGYPYHVNDAVLFGQEIGFEIAPAHISHHSNLQVRNIVSHNGTQVLFFAEFPFSEIFFPKQLPAGFIAKLHIVYAAFDVSFVKFGNKFISKLEIVAKPAVPDGCIQNFDVAPHFHEVSFSWCHCFALLIFML